MTVSNYQFTQPWKRIRFNGFEMWQCGSILVRREHESYGLWVVVYYGNQSCHVWKTARAAKKAAESTTNPIVIKSHISDVGYDEVFPFFSPAQSSDAVGQGGTIHDCRNTSDCLCLKCFEALGSLGGNQ